MIEADKRKAIYLMHQEGMSLKELVRRFKLSRNTVRKIIRAKGETPVFNRRDKIQIDTDLLGRLYLECDGRIQRVYEKLGEEEKIHVKYSTLTRLIRELGVGRSQETRCDRVPDEPGAEMQHDTSVYQIALAGVLNRLIASLMYLRYSKRKYLKFYRVFNRFRMKCFLHEGLMHWGYAAHQCIIDNTNLARMRGTGSNAVIVPEMAAFAEEHGFHFVCHKVKHPNRKAGEEKGLSTVETNFLPGRKFANLEDLNRQAFEWSTVRMDNRPVAKTGLIPAKAFEYERAFLVQLPRHLPAPNRIHEHGTDQYGYVAFDGNYFWVPGTGRSAVKLIEYVDRLEIYLNRKREAEYPLPADGVKNQRFSPEGMPPPRYQPRNRKRPTEEEEKRLRAMSPAAGAYVDFVLKEGGIQRHRFIRELFALAGRMPQSVFLQAMERALRYRIASLETVERIALLHMTQDVPSLPCFEVDEAYRAREAYLEGNLTDSPDLSIYDRLLEEDDE